jgi:hypothetical protein
MKINFKITALTMNLALLYAQNGQASSHDDFEEEMLASMHRMQEQIDRVQSTMQKSLKEFHNDFFKNFETRSNNFPSYTSEQKIDNNQSRLQSYQQSSSSLSFANMDKSIKIAEQKDNQSTTYIISVINKNSPDNVITSTDNQESHIQAELQDLEIYIKKNFHSKPAERILEECMKTMTEEHKDRLINIGLSTDGNQKKYTIEIAHKKEADIDAILTKKNRKNKN